MSDFVLEIVEGPGAGRQLALDHTLEVGREPGGVVLDDELVSRHHARFAPHPHSAVVEDVGSLNGTFVNEQPVEGTRVLAPGDHIRVGVTVFELRRAAELVDRPSAVRPVPAITRVGGDVLQPAGARELPPLRAQETPPGYLPVSVVGDPAAQSDYGALARLVDVYVKRQTSWAAAAALAVAGLAVVIFLGVR